MQQLITEHRQLLICYKKIQKTTYVGVKRRQFTKEQIPFLVQHVLEHFCCALLFAVIYLRVIQRWHICNTTRRQYSSGNATIVKKPK